MSSISVVVPVYNAELFIVEFLRELMISLSSLPNKTEIVIVDDGSSDATASVCKEILLQQWPNHQVLVLRENKGQYNATVAGCAIATGSLLITIDNDFAPHPKVIPSILMKHAVPDLAVLYGEFKSYKPFFRDIGSSIFNLIISALVNKDVGKHTGSSFRIFSRSLFTDLNKSNFPPILFDVVLMNGANSVAFIDLGEVPYRNRTGYNFLALARIFYTLVMGIITYKFYGSTHKS